MIFEILVWCVLGPLCVAGTCFGLAVYLGNWPSERWRDLWPGVPLTVGGWVAGSFLAVAGRHGFSWWPAEPWQSVIVPIGVVSLTIGLCQGRSENWIATKWWLAGIGMAWVAFCSMPTGEGWQDALPLHGQWMFLVFTGGLSNIYWLEKLAASGAERWVGWTCSAGLAGLTILAGTIYGGLAEWCLSACTITGLGAILGMYWPTARLWTTILPASHFLAAGTASCRFYNYAELPLWLYMLVMFAPSMVALTDRVLVRLSDSSRMSMARPIVAGFLSTCILLVIALTLLLPQE